VSGANKLSPISIKIKVTFFFNAHSMFLLINIKANNIYSPRRCWPSLYQAPFGKYLENRLTFYCHPNESYQQVIERQVNRLFFLYCQKANSKYLIF
jgi:hypothetical protein